MLTPATALRKDLNTGKATMEHRHFATVAAILKNMRNTVPDISEDMHDTIATEFAHELASTNPKFDRKRFLAACGV